jgi:glycosyltransferase involved in cell wall biosynthesis
MVGASGHDYQDILPILWRRRRVENDPAAGKEHGIFAPASTSIYPGDPLVTIAIPTFNRASLLKQCVASVLAQTYDRFEIVVSDNASTDETQTILSEFGDDRLRIIRQEKNIGLNLNWNACLAAARGDYVIFLPDDDRIAPHLLERCCTLVRAEPQLPIVVTLSNPHSVSLGKTFRARASRTLSTGIWDGSDILLDYLTDQITVTMCSVMLRTELVRANGGIPHGYPHTGDFATWAPLLLAGKAGFVNEACAMFTYHNESETARLSVELLIGDSRKVVEFISRQVDEHVQVAEKRNTLKAEARRCFARRGLVILADYRKNGGAAQRLVNFLWQFRHDLQSVDLASALRFAATVLCPQVIADWLRRLRPDVT